MSDAEWKRAFSVDLDGVWYGCKVVLPYMLEKGKEFGATTGRTRRCGWLDLVALKKVVELAGIDRLCITKIDVLTGLEELFVCTGYKINYSVIKNFPDAELTDINLKGEDEPND